MLTRDEIEALGDVELDNLFALAEDVRGERRRTRAKERKLEKANARALEALLNVEAEFMAQGADPETVRELLATKEPGTKTEKPPKPGPDTDTEVKPLKDEKPPKEPDPVPDPVPEEPQISPEDSSVPPQAP